jgi:hypothetical protein
VLLDIMAAVVSAQGEQSAPIFTKIIVQSAPSWSASTRPQDEDATPASGEVLGEKNK